MTLPGGEVIHFEFAWPEATLAVEPGHTWWHGGDARMTGDYARDVASGLVGWYVMRYSEVAPAGMADLARRC